METRKITVIETKNQKKSVIMSAATTLEELKVDFDAAGIDYTDMVFFEGTSKTELKSNSSILPHDVPYKGTTTNELVFMLTNNNKKIESGADSISRFEIYNEIMHNPSLKDYIKEKTNRNYTNVSTDKLQELTQEFNNQNLKEFDNAMEEVRDKVHEELQSLNTIKVIDTELRALMLDFIGQIFINGGITKEQYFNFVDRFPQNIQVLNNETLKSSYSDDELNEMFEDLF